MDQSITTTDERASRLEAVAKIISFWNSQVPPPEFELGLTDETFLTVEERKGRLGIDSSSMVNEDSILSTGSRGKFERFEFDFVEEENDGDGDNVSEEGSMTTTGDNGDARLRKKKRIRRMLQDTPSSIDWAEQGYTTNIKNQGLCGCCWAVSVAGAVESALMITNQTSRYDSEDKNSLSVQQMISCDKQELGCQGGNILMATRYVWEHDDFNNGGFGGLYSAKDWPYTDILGTTTEECNAQQKVDSGEVPAAYLNYPKVVNSVNDRSSFEERRDRLMAAVAQQPVTSVMRSGCDLFMSYRGGVLTHDQGCECCETSCIDHAIVIVGYDASGPTPYWKLRNSYGPNWGEEGHFRIAMNDASCGWGLFGMLAEAALPSDSYENLEDLPERPSWWETAQTWEKVLVILFSILGFCCLCSCIGAFCKRSK